MSVFLYAEQCAQNMDRIKIYVLFIFPQHDPLRFMFVYLLRKLKPGDFMKTVRNIAFICIMCSSFQSAYCVFIFNTLIGSLVLHTKICR